MDETEEIARVIGPVEAEVVRALLESYGIPVQATSSLSLSVWPLSINGLGEVRILVRSVDAQAARDQLAQHHRGGLVLVPEDDCEAEQG